jgi:hypothetical protein
MPNKTQQSFSNGLIHQTGNALALMKADLPRIEYDATSNYNAFQLTANRRFIKGVQFGFAWTWSKAMDFDTSARFDRTGAQVNGNFGAFSAATNPRKIQLAMRASF